MGARTLTSKFTHVHISTVRRPGNTVGIGIVFRTRQGANVRKTAYAVRDVPLEQATYEAVLAALDQATRVQARGVMVYVDSPKVVAQLNRSARVPPELGWSRGRISGMSTTRPMSCPIFCARSAVRTSR